jgi:hypothetical protein
MCASSPSHLLLNKYCQYGLVHVIEDLNSRNRVSNRTNNSPQHLCRWERSSSLLWCIHSSRIYLIYPVEWNYYAKISDIFLCAEASALMKSIPWIYKWANALVPPTPIWRAMVMEPSEPMAVTGSMSIQVRAMWSKGVAVWVAVFEFGWTHNKW